MKANIIAISGKMHSGKTTTALMILDYLNDSNYRRSSNLPSSKKSVQTYQTKIVKFAEPLYQIQNFCYQTINRPPPPQKDRKLLQYLGTEWGRSIDKDLWVNLWRQEARAHLFKKANLTQQVVICDDVRFDNEAKQVVELGGKIIRVECKDSAREERMHVTFTGTNHASEQGIDDQYIFSTIFNNGSVEDLRKNVKYLVEEIL